MKDLKQELQKKEEALVKIESIKQQLIGQIYLLKELMENPEPEKME